MGLAGFDEEYYLASKLAALQSSERGWLGRSVDDLRQLLSDAGMTAESHYTLYGWREGLSPNALFNAAEYAAHKGAQLFATGVYPSPEAAVDAFRSAWDGDLYQHYLSYGAFEGLDPSDAFSTRDYLQQKLASLQAADDAFLSWGVEDVASAFRSAGLTALTHYLEYGRDEGLRYGSAGEGVYSIAELRGLTALPERFSLRDSWAAISSHLDIVERAESYSLTDATGSDFGQLRSDLIDVVQNASNYQHTRWRMDMVKTAVGDESDAAPYDGVVYLLATFPDGSMYRGSGAIVGYNDVLTASHVVYSAEHGGVADSVRVIPGYNGETSPWGRGKLVTDIKYFPVDQDGDGLLSPADGSDDIALLTVAGKISGTVFELAADAGTGYYNMTGYPAGYENGAGNNLMVNDYGRAEESGWYDVLMFDTLDPESGSSGGPVWFRDGDSCKVAGVVSTGGWACDVSGHYAELVDWMTANDSPAGGRVQLAGLPPEPVDLAYA